MADTIFVVAFAYGSIGLCATSIFFLKFMASILSLITTTNKSLRRAPGEYYVTGGLLPMWRVISEERNAHANRILLKNLLYTILAFGVTMAPFVVLMEYTQ